MREYRGEGIDFESDRPSVWKDFLWVVTMEKALHIGELLFIGIEEWIVEVRIKVETNMEKRFKHSGKLIQ